MASFLLWYLPGMQTLIIKIRILLLAGLLLAAGIPAGVRAADNELPIFHGGEAASAIFRPVLQAYNNGDFSGALKEAGRLTQLQMTETQAETSAFLQGDLYLRLAEDGQSDQYDRALAAFQKAVHLYPESENAVRAFWRIGQIYLQKKLYYESIASYRRILKSHPDSRFAVLAQLGIARTYQTWGKWKQAAQAYDQLNFSALSPKERVPALFQYADVLYILDDFEKAYQVYDDGTRLAPLYLRNHPDELFQFGESSYRIEKYGRAKETFSRLLNIYPKDPMASVALSRLGNIEEQEGNKTAAAKIYDHLHALYPDSEGERMTLLLQAIESLGYRKQCLPPLFPSGPVACKPAETQDPEKERAAFQEIEDRSLALLGETNLPSSFKEVLFEASAQLVTKSRYSAALEIQDKLLRSLPQSRFRKKVADAYSLTMTGAINQSVKLSDDIAVVELFHAYPSSFTPQMLTSAVGMLVAASHVRTGLLTQAVQIYEPIAASTLNPHAEDALYLLGKTLSEQNEYPKAQQKLAQFLARYPQSVHAPEALAGMAEALDHQGSTEQAISKYRQWLNRYKRHPDQRDIALRLAGAYERNEEYDEAVKIYFYLVQEMDKPSELYLRLADAFFNSSRYHKAALYYEQIIKEENGADPAKLDWIKFKLAKSYQALDMRREGQALFGALAQNAKDPLIRQIALEKNREF